MKFLIRIQKVRYKEIKDAKADFRFISKEFLEKQEVDGGLPATSLWMIQPDMKKLLEEALLDDDFEEIIEWDEP